MGMSDVPKFPGLFKRPRSSNWQVRVKVPTELQHLYSSDQLTKSLGTPDREEAEARWYIVTGEWRDQFDRQKAELRARYAEEPEPAQPRTVRRQSVRRPENETGKPLTISAATELARRWFRQQLANRCVAVPDDLDFAIAEAQGTLAHLSRPDDPGTMAITQQAAYTVIGQNGYNGSVGETAFDHLTELLRQAMVQLEHLDLQWLETGSDDHIRSTLFGPKTNQMFAAPSTHQTPTTPEGGIFGEVLDRYQSETWDERSDADKRDASKVTRWTNAIQEYFGASTDLNTITPLDVDGFFKLIERQPKLHAKRYPGLNLEEAAQQAEKDGAKLLAYRTRDGYRRELKRFFEWSRLQGLMNNDPLSIVKRGRRKPGDETHREPFDTAELKQMFQAPIYTGCQSEEYGSNKPGTEKPRRGRFWLPLLGLFTGARVGELAQLRVEDFKQTEAGTHYFAIRKAHDWMSAKTPNAIRDVPVHEELIRLGLLDFVDEQRKKGEEQLFPEMLNIGDRTSKRFSALFSRFLIANDLKREGLTFHSFRHTARQSLRRADLFREAGHKADELIDDAFGWSKGQGMASRYGEDWPVDELVKLVALIEYPGLDLSHLYPRASKGSERANNPIYLGHHQSPSRGL
jgi:integrase